MTRKFGTAAINIALIGCGRIAQTYLEAIAECSACKLVAIADVRPQAAKSVAAQIGCKYFTDYRQVIEGNSVDAVIICTPPNTHHEIGIFFLENHIHVFCEQPFALNTGDASFLVKKAEEKNSLLMVASQYRYVDDIIRTKNVVESGILGDIILLENVFCDKINMGNRWNSKKSIAGGGVLIDKGSYSADIAQYLVGPIVKVRAEERKKCQSLEVEDTACLYFKTRADVMGVVELSWSFYKDRESYIKLFGTEGVLSVGWTASKYRHSGELDWVSFGKGYNKLSAFTRQLANFIGSIRGEEPPLITASESLETVKVIEAAYRSILLDTWIEIDSLQDEVLGPRECQRETPKASAGK